jgi:PucR C-terminal helix-turn-helix domain/GGDEF-like domain
MTGEPLLADPDKATKAAEPLGDLRTLAAGRVARLARDVATQFSDQAEEIARTMVRTYETEIPTYAAIRDQALKDDVHSVSTALVRCWLTVMSTGRPPSRDLLDPVLEGVRRRAHQGVDLESVLRAYRVGIRVLWSEITSSDVWPHEGEMAQVATWTLDFSDRIATAVAAAYSDELELLARERERRRSALLNVILAGPVAEPLDAPAELERRHSVAVARVAPDLTLAELERAGQRLEERAGAMLWTVRYQSVVAAIGWATPVGRDQLTRDLARLVDGRLIVAIGLGGCAEGVDETRSSYAEAISALRLGPLVGRPEDVVFDFHDLAALAALLEDPDRARRFAASVLEPLGDLASRRWALPTLEAYLVRQGRLKQAAADLGVHLNTVKYRLRELRPIVDPITSGGERAGTLLLALRVARVLDADPPTRRPEGSGETVAPAQAAGGS